MKTMTDLKQHIGFLQSASSLLMLTLASLLQVDLISLEGAAQTSNQTTSVPSRPQFQLGGRCLRKSSCSLPSAPSQTDFGLDRPACHCDQSCALYDDCCYDSSWAATTSKRVELGTSRLRARRREWLCRRLDPTLGAVYIRASCHPDWARGQKSNATAELVRQRCELAGPPDASPLYSDPLGSLMPITDKTDGITYANSYCLRCNSFGITQARRKLIYWSPLISCNYNLDSDDRNVLYDLISSKGGRALAYSKRHNRWFVKMSQAAANGTDSTKRAPESEGDELDTERICSVSPRVPDSVVHTMRHCRPRTVDVCPASSNRRPANETVRGELERARHECHFGHQAIVYSQTRDLAYYNLACAICNFETQVSCEPRLGKQIQSAPGMMRRPAQHQKHLSAARTSPPAEATAHSPLDSIEQPDDNQLDGAFEITAARNQGGLQPIDDSDSSRTPVSGSFSVLMDLYGGGNDEQVGLVHRCEDVERQVYDPFLLTCRDIVCGLSHRFEDGVCVQLEETGDAESSLSVGSSAVSPSGDKTAPTEIAPTELTIEVNGTADGDKRPSSSGQKVNEKLVVELASGQGERQVGAGGQRVEREERTDHKQGTAALDKQVITTTMPAITQSDSDSGQTPDDNNSFVALFRELKIARPSLQSTVESSRKSFADCGKIIVQPEHYRLFTIDELSSSLATPEWLAVRPNPSVWDHNGQRESWALVAPYNLTLAPGQFRPVRANGRQQLGLLVCSPFKSDLVDKFKPAMVYLTTCCLVISITSLIFYLMLYCLSTFDLRHLVVELTQAGQVKDSLRNNALSSPFRESRASTETSYNAVRSQNLSSRGVACLAAALLAAYLLFVLGHHHQSSSAPNSTGGGPNSCAMIAAATYGSFLLAFNWMFLLSYDIWRTLRLATCQLRTPTMGSQTSRFLIYAALAAFVAISMALLALLTDQMDVTPDCQASASQNEPLGSSNCSRPLQLDLIEHFVQVYRPKFGQRAGSCWFSNRRSLALFFGLPVTLIMLVNLLFFLHSSYMVIRTSSRSSRRLKPTNSTWSQASEQAADFTQQNSLTTSSISSVQTIQSTISVQSAQSTSSCVQESEKERKFEGFESAGRIQIEIDEVAKRLNEQQQESAADMKHPSLEKTRQTSFNGSFASGSQISFTDQLLASSLVHKCDLHLSNLGSLVSSLAKDYRLYCRLSTIMGLTWLTGLAASLVDQSDALWYLFVVLNSLQGLFIFVAFGLKRSRLTNLKIMFVYIDHMLKQKLLKDQGQTGQKLA